MAYWDEQYRTNCIEKQKAGYMTACEILTGYDNVDLYFWTDTEMLEIMCDLNNYRDQTHYSSKISKDLLKRIENKEGLLNKDNYSNEVNKFFNFIESYNYDSLFD